VYRAGSAAKYDIEEGEEWQAFKRRIAIVAGFTVL
jgi:hypothetical protein